VAVAFGLEVVLEVVLRCVAFSGWLMAFEVVLRVLVWRFVGVVRAAMLPWVGLRVSIWLAISINEAMVC
jgi:hypothetical protein